MNKKNLFCNIMDMPYGRTTPYHLFDAAKNSRELVQKLTLQRKIPVHEGCVNSICWNDTGKYLLSGSDDQRLSVVHGYDYSVLAYIHTGHRANIFSAKFLPNTGDSHVISCSGDGIIIYSDLERPETSLNNKFNCHRGTAYEIMTVPNDPNTFLSCGEDRSVRWFDIRTKTSCNKEDCKDDILINCQSPVTSLAVNPLTPYQLAVGCADASVRIFDRRMLCTQNGAVFFASNGFQALMSCFTVPEFTRSRRITSLCYSADGQEMLVSYSSDYIYLFDIKDNLEKKPKLLSKEGSSNDSDNDSGLFFRGRPLMKRLRIRGDWSDTGPNARPEAESRDSEEPSSSRANIAHAMRNILSRMLNTTQARSRSNASRSSSASSHGSSQSEEAEPASDSVDDGDHLMERTASTPVGNSDAPSKRKEKPEKESDPSNRSPAAKSKCIKKADINQPTSSAFVDDKPSTSSYNAFSEPSTSCDIKNNEVSIDNNVNKLSREVSSSSVNRKTEEQIEADISDESNFETIEKKLESQRKDLIEKHHTEPMVNLHYSGQSVNSGQITMEVASSSTANERQWLEQSVSDLPELPSHVVNQEQSNELPAVQVHETSQRAEVPSERSSAESDTETGIQLIQPNQNLLPLISNMSSLANSSSRELQMDNSGRTDERDVELLMEVDSWDMDSDDDTRRDSRTARGSQTSRRLQLQGPSTSFMDSISDEVKSSNDELKKAEARMSTVSQPRVKKKYTGHRNARTMIKESTFWGDNFIMSGSDCGHIFIWDRHTTELVMIMEADHHVVNCLQPHPFDPILASSGIDYDIKLWAPSREEPFFDEDKAKEIIKRNKIMLEETKDTITVPASFMFRMFTTLSHFRTGRANRWGRAAREMRSGNSDSSQ